MKVKKIVSISAVVCVLSLSLLVGVNAQNTTQAEMPSGMSVDPMMMQNMEKMRQQQMQQNPDGSPIMMMDPTMMQNMMRMHQLQMHQGNGNNMPMMGGGNNRMMMDPVMRQNMMQMRQQKMGQHYRGGMMNPQMMQMRQQHMSTMEQRLSNIEALLTELVELQKNSK